MRSVNCGIRTARSLQDPAIIKPVTKRHSGPAGSQQGFACDAGLACHCPVPEGSEVIAGGETVWKVRIPFPTHAQPCAPRKKSKQRLKLRRGRGESCREPVAAVSPCEKENLDRRGSQPL